MSALLALVAIWLAFNVGLLLGCLLLDRVQS